MTRRVALPAGIVRLAVRAYAPAIRSTALPVAAQRRLADRAASLLPVPRGCRASRTTVDGVPVEHITPASDTGPITVLYLHGGGYTIGSPRSHRAVTARLAIRLRATVVVPAYRLAPEHPYPAALDDALRTYRGLLETGSAAKHIVVVGDSAGGGLALAMAMALRADHTPLPAAIGLICPWLDLAPDLSGTRMAVSREPLLTPATLARWARYYTADGGADADPAVSPLRGDLAGLPPLIIQSSEADPLADDARRLEQRAREAGINVEHRHYTGLWHNFQALADVLAQADQAISDLATSVRRHLPAHTDDVRVGVIGTGVSGLAMGVRLRQAGIEDFRIYDKAHEIGGTWRDNTYPGLHCDVPSRFYSYSFAPNPGWTRQFAPGREIHRYLVGVADRFKLWQDIRLDCEITSARWDGDGWHLRTSTGDEDRVDVLITATGVLHHPRTPDIKGLGTFTGAAFHSSRWDHSVSPKGRRIAVIGTGSSGVQIVTALSRTAGKLLVFQRTPQWILPAPNRGYTPIGKALLRWVPLLNRAAYRLYQGIQEMLARATIQPGWQRCVMSAACRLNLRLAVRDPELRRRLTPSDEPLCKRLVISAGFYPAMQRSGVHLVTDEIECIEPTGIRTRDGTLHEVDIIVYATGFDSHAYVRPLQLTGEHGITLDEVWKDGPYGYRTVALPGFPNFFMLIGPHSPIGNHSYIAIAETQADYIVQWINRLRRREVVGFSPTAEATERFNSQLRTAMPRTVWTTGCANWYLGRDGIPETWPWTPGDHRAMLRHPIDKDFRMQRPGDATTRRLSDAPSG